MKSLSPTSRRHISFEENIRVPFSNKDNCSPTEKKKDYCLNLLVKIKNKLEPPQRHGQLLGVRMSEGVMHMPNGKVLHLATRDFTFNNPRKHNLCYNQSKRALFCCDHKNSPSLILHKAEGLLIMLQKNPAVCGLIPDERKIPIVQWRREISNLVNMTGILV
jgi:hypothetical protein